MRPRTSKLVREQVRSLKSTYKMTPATPRQSMQQYRYLWANGASWSWSPLP